MPFYLETIEAGGDRIRKGVGLDNNGGSSLDDGGSSDGGSSRITTTGDATAGKDVAGKDAARGGDSRGHEADESKLKITNALKHPRGNTP